MQKPGLSPSERSSLLGIAESGYSSHSHTISPHGLPPAAASVSIERSVLLRALHVRSRRFHQCRSLPLSLLSYIAFVSAILLHAKVGVTYDLESAAKATFVEGTGFGDLGGSADSWYDWAKDSYLPQVLPAQPGSTEWALRPLNSYTVVVGGVRLAQARSPAAACTEDAGLRALYNGSCYPSQLLTRAPYGTAPAPGVAAAFAGNSSRGPEGRAALPYAFELLIDAEEDLGTGAARIEDLRSGGWLDPATRSATTTLVLFNGQISYWCTVRTTMDVQRGGRLALSSHVGSFPADPYGAPPSDLTSATDGTGGAEGSSVAPSLLVFLDLVIAAYFAYLVTGSVRRVWSRVKVACRQLRKGRAGDSTGSGSSSSSSISSVGDSMGGSMGGSGIDVFGDDLGEPLPHQTPVEIFLGLLSWWMLLDWATIVSLVVTFAYWGAFCSAVRGIRGEFDSASSAAAAGLGASLFASAAFSATAARVLATQLLWESVKTSATVALICLTLRLFKYFQFQPRLSVMTEALSLAFNDGFHFAFLLGILLSEWEGVRAPGQLLNWQASHSHAHTRTHTHTHTALLCSLLWHLGRVYVWLAVPWLELHPLSHAHCHLHHDV